MRIQNNITALNTHRQYGIANNSVASSAEKLSSGYRINRAGDDAAGLAISEKMRAQIRGLNMASKNSQDAVSLVQTAEGALQESHNILQRMRELAVQSASDTNETKIDRGALDQEYQQLIKELDDIAGKTKFNDMPVIDGTYAQNLKSAQSGTTGTIGWASAATADGTYTITSNVRQLTAAVTGSTGSTTQSVTVQSSLSGVTVSFVTGAGACSDTINGNWTLGYSAGKFTATNGTTGEVRTVIGPSSLASAASVTLNFGADLGSVVVKNESSQTISNQTDWGISGTLTVKNAEAQKAATYVHIAELNGDEVELQANQSTLVFKNAGISVKLNGVISAGDVAATNAASVGISGTGFTIGITVSTTARDPMVIQSGANQGDELRISVEKMDAQTLGVRFSNIGNRADASTAITQVNMATNMVSTQRASLGALQNRLTHKIANLDTSAENLAAAESRIRDVDMAKEMTEFTKKNILVQASTAMLAQANSAPQNVLSLLR